MTEPRLIYRLTPGMREFLLQVLIEHWQCDECTDAHTDHLGNTLQYHDLLKFFSQSTEREKPDGHDRHETNDAGN